MANERPIESASPGWRGLRLAYSSAALLLFNVVVLLVAANLLLWVAFGVRDAMRSSGSTSAPGATGERSIAGFSVDGAPLSGPRRSTYQRDWFDLYAYGTAADAPRAAIILDDFFELARKGFVYQPWTGFAEPPFEGQLVHVDEDSEGFPRRRTRNVQVDAARPTLRIFALGGSTTFGYNVADDETWPSALAATLTRRAAALGTDITVTVENYGRGYFNPSQEVILLWNLVRSGHRPDVVIFMDGVNLGSAEDVPHFTDQTAAGFRQIQFGGESNWMQALGWIPMVRLASALRPSGAERGGAPESREGSVRKTEHLVERFVSSWNLAEEICQSYGIRCLFFLQPDPVFNYSFQLYRRPPPPALVAERAERERFYATLGRPNRAIDLTGLFISWGPERKAIVDDVHYSPEFNRLLAEEVAKHLDLPALADAKLGAREMPGARPTGSAYKSGMLGP